MRYSFNNQKNHTDDVIPLTRTFNERGIFFLFSRWLLFLILNFSFFFKLKFYLITYLHLMLSICFTFFTLSFPRTYILFDFCYCQEIFYLFNLQLTKTAEENWYTPTIFLNFEIVSFLNL